MASKVNDINIIEQNGIVHIGDNITYINRSCLCNSGNHHHDYNNPVQETLSFNATPGRISIEPVRPNFPLNDNDHNSHRDTVSDFDSGVCVCAVHRQDNHISLERSLSRCVTNLIQDNNSECTHFEVQFKVKITCKKCMERNLVATYNYTSEEYECTLTSSMDDFDENKPLRLNRVSCQPQSETPFQAFLAKSQNIIKEEGNFIRIITKIYENGRKVRIKLRFDVRSSVKRRAKSFSDLDTLKQVQVSKNISKKSNSFTNIHEKCFSKSCTSLVGNAHSRITILDGEANVEDSANSEEILHKIDKNICELGDDVTDGADKALNGFPDREYFSSGKFGHLYKVCREGRHQLIKVVPKTEPGNETFIEEAKQFCKCKHPFIRPTVGIIEGNEKSLVFYWFLDGQSLFEAIEANVIRNYLTYFRILYGIVKGLAYLKGMGITCKFLTPEKVLLDSSFNPRISGVGLSYFKSPEDTQTQTNHAHGFHRSLSYLDVNLRSRKTIHPKNVLWSVGICIWDMLLGKICQKAGQEDILSEHKILTYLETPCDSQTIKSACFSDKLRKIVYGAGWPRNKEITKSLVVLAVRCMMLDLEERMSLEDLSNKLEIESCELRKNEKMSLYENVDNLCLYCINNAKGNLSLTCGCATACYDCLRNTGALECPEHGIHHSKIGHPLAYGLIIQGEFTENKRITENDSVAMELLFNDKEIFAFKNGNMRRLNMKSQSEAFEELGRIKKKILEDKKKKENEKYPTTLLLHLTGHCNESGSLILQNGDKPNDKKIFKKKILCEFIRDVNPKNLVVFANGHYSEKLVKSLSESQKCNFFTNNSKFFGVFSHAGNLCGMSHEDISVDNSIFVSFILDILKKDAVSSGSNGAIKDKRHLTASEFTAEISERMKTRFNRCLKPIDKDGRDIPIAYI
ncbi:uncharacterized protein LOC114526299 [Dendronephthya gigantea]|uniref:uncharacterized protein LOC114526299 n=1 Tax=Dendronephthya gigantea TaxID=151771 RepID=UPI00106994C1|nr:uncharacterized protein LOC114526299 [Dendronephthya gigantea]